MVTTVAPTIPVEAPSKAPTTTTEMARPPLRRPNRMAMVSSSFSANPERSSITPMNTKRGTAIRVTLVIRPQIRRGSRSKKDQPKPMRPKNRAVPSSVKATGKPAISRMVSARNIQPARYSIRMFPPRMLPGRPAEEDCAGPGRALAG